MIQLNKIYIDSDCSLCSGYGEFLKNRNSDLILANQLDLDSEDISKDELVYERNNKKYTFIVVSRLDKNKNIITPLKAFLKLKQKDTNLVIIGNGPEYKNLKKIINKNNVKILKNSSRLNMLQNLSRALYGAKILGTFPRNF